MTTRVGQNGLTLSRRDSSSSVLNTIHRLSAFAELLLTITTFMNHSTALRKSDTPEQRTKLAIVCTDDPLSLFESNRWPRGDIAHHMVKTGT